MSESLIVEGDMLDYPQADYLVQQCNCLTVRAAGLAKSLADKFPDADLYSKRKQLKDRNLAIEKDRPPVGSIDVCLKSGVVCFYSQWRPGKVDSPFFSVYPENKLEPETYATRLKWFAKCLKTLKQYLNGAKVTVAFPYLIGCGLAGGNWKDYHKMLKQFSIENENIKVVILQRSCDK